MYAKFGPQGELLSKPEAIGNVLVLPLLYRAQSATRKRTRKHSTAKILEFARLRSAAPAIEGGNDFKELPGQKGPGHLR